MRRILLDNFTIEETLKAVDLIGTLCETESSGNIAEKTILQYANCGVNYISVGALTHSVYNMDLSLKAFWWGVFLFVRSNTLVKALANKVSVFILLGMLF